MATTFKIDINSDINGDEPMTFDTSFTGKDGSDEEADAFDNQKGMGVVRVNGDAFQTIVDMDSTQGRSLSGKNAVLYVKNKSTVFDITITLTVGDKANTHVAFAKLHGGESMLVPLVNTANSNYTGTSAGTLDSDINVIASADHTLVEYLLIYKI